MLDFLGIVVILIVGAHLGRRMTIMADKFDPLVAEVAALRETTESAIATINNLADQFEEAKDDPEQVQALVDDLRGQREALADAIANPGTDDDTDADADSDADADADADSDADTDEDTDQPTA